ncbi:lipocalin family protein [Cellvibrio sp.]|uniref:lipocalin family protein n=1 Tax=Cellvibrio sp. TaxID=1965322 RepID=UPI003F4B7428
MKYFLLSMVFLLASCTGTPDNIKPVQGFEVNRYLGTWYEIARLDHRFERGLSQVTAEYSLREDGGVKVINLGYSQDEKAWDAAEGKAYFVGEPDSGHLKVSFWGPFYSSYVIFQLDKANYQYALVSGADKDYFWILARTPQIEPALLAQLIEQAKSLGFATNQLILVDHHSKATQSSKADHIN